MDEYEGMICKDEYKFFQAVGVFFRIMSTTKLQKVKSI